MSISSSAVTGAEPPPRLILHVNTYKTIWTCDLDNDKTTEYVLQEALSETSWGMLKLETHEWELAEGDRATFTPSDDSLITFSDYLLSQFPIEGDHLDDSTIAEHHRQIRLKTGDFTSKSFGNKLMPLLDQMVKNLAMPKPVLKSLGITKVSLVETDLPENPLDEDEINCARFGRYRIVPSFLNFVTQLVKDERDFQIVFRGFGTVLEEVKKEWNVYCEGKHPCFNGKNKTKQVLLNGKKNSRDMRITDENTGIFDRMGQCLEFPARNATKAAVGHGDFVMFTPTKYAQSHGIYTGINEIAAEGTVMIRDDYEFFEGNYYSPSSSKLLYLDQADHKVHNIFLDGSLTSSANKATIDTRDAVTGEELDYDSVINIDLFRVNFVKAITEPTYFMDILPELEKGFKTRIKRWREEAYEKRLEQCVQPARIDQEETATDLSSKAYIYQHIIPALAPALEICTRDRPPDPLEFIAFYMLRHKTQYSKSVKIAAQ